MPPEQYHAHAGDGLVALLVERDRQIVDVIEVVRVPAARILGQLLIARAATIAVSMHGERAIGRHRRQQVGKAKPIGAARSGRRHGSAATAVSPL